MGFLAFLLIGGISGAAAWIFYPKSSKAHGPKGFILAVLVGCIAAAGSSYLGQFVGFFQSGQMLEWLSAILASCALACIYSALVK